MCLLWRVTYTYSDHIRDELVGFLLDFWRELVKFLQLSQPAFVPAYTIYIHVYHRIMYIKIPDVFVCASRTLLGAHTEQLYSYLGGPQNHIRMTI